MLFVFFHMQNMNSVQCFMYGCDMEFKIFCKIFGKVYNALCMFVLSSPGGGSRPRPPPSPRALVPSREPRSATPCPRDKPRSAAAAAATPSSSGRAERKTATVLPAPLSSPATRPRFLLRRNCFERSVVYILR